MSSITSKTQQPSATYLVGIDLGTTHSVVAYADLNKELTSDNCQIFEIDQLIAPGEIARKPLLPSFRYHPLPGEVATEDCQLPWSNDSDNSLDPALKTASDQVIIGHWARLLGTKTTGRQVVSAKSWLSHPQIDQNADILPWTGGEDVYKVSPMIASASYLLHIRKSWDYHHPEAHLADQQVSITVPASFDEQARALTVEAARLAGLDNILLLEEPQAVCYDWYARQGDQVDTQLQKLKLLLVCDVGGGTTDLSLIEIQHDDSGKLSLNRIGVGDHLMLGGDNIDLALAHLAEQKINPQAQTKKLSAAQLSQLIQQTRQVKESLLANNAADTAKVTLLGSGSKLISGSKSAELDKATVHQIALDGFFPISPITEHPKAQRSAIVEFGLPYASDPAITKHVAKFICDHQNGCRSALQLEDQSLAVPDAILFNGGVFNSPLIQNQAMQAFSLWSNDESETSLTLLENHHPDLSVACGAVAYLKARQGAQLKIGGGSARSFYLKVDDSKGSQLVSLLPKGTEEEETLTLKDRDFKLKLNQPVQFTIVSDNSDQVHKPGTVINYDEQNAHLTVLPAMSTVLKASNSSDTESLDQHQNIIVQISARLTEVGTLNIECISRDDKVSGKWQLEFSIRKNSNPESSVHSEHSAVSLPARFDDALNLLNETYGTSNNKPNPKQIKTLRQDLEKAIGKRDQWDSDTLRHLADVFIENSKRRKRSAAHERIWLNLCGYGCRPGFGYELDEWRIEKLWPLFQQGIQFHQETPVWVEWWTFWRRISGGLTSDQQELIYKQIQKFFNPAALRNRKLQTEAKQKSYEDMVKLAATLEHLNTNDKRQLVEWLLKRLEKPAETNTSWWAVARLAARIPFYTSVHNVIDPKEIEKWLPQLLKHDWKKQQHIAFSAVMMSRMSGDRTRDINDQSRTLIIDKLKNSKAPESWIEMVSEVKELDEQETKRVFGEGLPSGLSLIQ
jgi:molecular chaperone DnaK (HSP70)